jgi:gluconate 2-dehydrogenase gamma chain
MTTRDTSRRSFLFESVTGLSAAWVTANYAGILSAQDYVLAAQSAQASFSFFTPEQAAEIEAMAAQIIPTDQTPGAREARVVHFIDRALVTFQRSVQPVYRRGLDELLAQSRQVVAGAARFSALTSAQQIQVLTAMEKTPFFDLVRTHTITGFFASPVHGGNAGKVGWQLVGYDDSLNHKPPFGYYDAQDGNGV